MSRILLVSVTMTISACADTFLPPSVLDGPRVLAVEADPPEVGPGETATVRATTYLPAGRTIAKTNWKFCPLSAGATAGYACVNPACETSIDAATDGSAEIDPTAAIGACVQKLAAAGALPGAASGGASYSQPVETVVRLALQTDDGATLEAVLRLRFDPKGVAQRNRPPGVPRLSAFGEALVSGLNDASVKAGDVVTFTAHLDAAGMDSYVDGSGRTVTESPVVAWYATAGRFDGNTTNGLESTNGWTAAPLDGATQVTFYAVARDLRGGQSVAGPFTIAVTP